MSIVRPAGTATATCLLALMLATGLGLSAIDVSAQTVPQAKATKAAKTKAPTPDEQAPADGEQPAAAAKKKDPAEAQRNVENGITLLQSGKAEPAIQVLSSAISSGSLPPTMMAKALHQRGAAYRKVNKPAQAISDLTSALWVKGGLQDADRQDAVLQRTQAYREAGLPDQTGDDGQPAGAKSKATRAAAAGDAPATGGSASRVTTASLAPEPAPAPSGGGLFANLFGGFGGNKPAAQAATPAPAAQPAPPPATSGWASASVAPAAPTAKATNTKTASAAPAAATAAPAAPPVAVASTATTRTAAPAAGGVHARVALVKSQPEADTVIARLKKDYGAAIGARALETSPVQFGAMGSFIQVRVGPYANAAEAQGLCQKLKGSGLDCVPVN